ncbi:hypothetical protein Peur_007674 [Populus x canadensis]
MEDHPAYPRLLESCLVASLQHQGRSQLEFVLQQLHKISGPSARARMQIAVIRNLTP